MTSRLPLIVVLVATAALCGCVKKKAATRVEAARDPVAVRLIAPKRVEVQRKVRVTGTFFGDEETTVAAKVPGRIVEITKDVGDKVDPGQLLVRIDSIDYELAKIERERAFLQTLSSLGLDKLPGPDFETERVPSVERARLQAANAKIRYERARAVVEGQAQAMSEQEIDDLKTAWEAAESDLRVERLDVRSRLAQARTFEAQVKIAEQKIVDARVLAPVEVIGEGARSYQVAERMVAVGDFVQTGTPLLRLVDVDPAKFRAMVQARWSDLVKIGQTVAFPAPDNFGRGATGTIARISPTMDATARAFSVEVLVPNVGGAWKPGGFGVAAIDTVREKILVVPARAIVTFAGVEKVVAVKDGKAEERRIETGDAFPEGVEVKSGLKDGDMIVAEPTGALTTGTPVLPGEGPAAVAPASRKN